jgi:hypothetical protein
MTLDTWHKQEYGVSTPDKADEMVFSTYSSITAPN